MKDFDLSVLICSWNTKDDLRACLASLDSVRGEGNFEVVVIENNSADGSGDMVLREFPIVRLLQQYKNLGFTGGNNLGIAERRGRHALLLNSDTIVHPGAIKALLAAEKEHPEIGILGPKLLNPDGSLQFSCRRFPNPVAALFRNTPLGRLFPKNRFTRDYLMTDWDHSVPREVDWVSGAALLIREEALEKVGGLDPDFFMFCEDIDLCWRAKDAGFPTWYFPSAVISHKIGSSTSKAPNRMIFRFHRSMLLFYRKHQLRSVAAPLRPFAYMGAATALTLRASLFLVKNQIDRVTRWLKR